MPEFYKSEGRSAKQNHLCHTNLTGKFGVRPKIQPRLKIQTRVEVTAVAMVTAKAFAFRANANPKAFAIGWNFTIERVNAKAFALARPGAEAKVKVKARRSSKSMRTKKDNGKSWVLVSQAQAQRLVFATPDSVFCCVFFCNG